jgi:hypothetical protein
LKNNYKKHLRVLKKLGRDTLTDSVLSLIASEKIKIAGKTNQQIFTEGIKILSSEIKNESYIGIQCQVSCLDSILKEARHNYKEKNSKTSIILYATWCEHWINNIIKIKGRSKKLNPKEIDLILRRSSLAIKYRVLLPLFGLKRIYSSHFKALDKLFELRNQIIHYKWAENPLENKFRKERNTYVSEIEKTIKYLMNYENEQIFKNKKKAILKLSSKMSSEITLSIAE